jgi:hypothetical protein
MKLTELKEIIKEELQKVLEEAKLSKKELAAQYPPKDKITRGDFIALAKKKKGDDSNEEEEEGLEEKKMSKSKMKKREKFVKGMKGMAKDFEKRYPGRGKEVMYATATKMAQGKK